MFESLTLLPLTAIFLGSAAVIWVAGTRLTLTTDILDTRWRLGDALGGLILLAIATSLPETAITISAAVNHHIEVAIGNLIGGIAIQTVVLAYLDGASKDDRPLSYLAGSLVLVLEALLVISITTVVILATQLPPTAGLFHISPGSFLILGFWLGGLAIVNRARKLLPWKMVPDADPGRSHRERFRQEAEHRLARHGTAVVFGVFALAALATLAAGVSLEESGTRVAQHLGIGTGVFAATFIAAATALPEVSTGLASVKIGDNALAMSDIFGGNAFMPTLFVVADLLSGRPTLPHAQTSDLWLAGLGILLTGIYAAGLILRPKRQVARLGLDSILVLVLYGLGVAALFVI